MRCSFWPGFISVACAGRWRCSLCCCWRPRWSISTRSIFVISAYCVTSAYAFLVFAYGALWFVGRWYAARHAVSGKGVLGLMLAAAVAGSAAFVIANVSFYLLAGYFEQMSVVQYVASVAQYYLPYVAVMMFYVGLAFAVQVLARTFGKPRQETDAV